MKIFSASNPTEAHIICGLLESENIACEVRGEGLFGLKGFLNFLCYTAAELASIE